MRAHNAAHLRRPEFLRGLGFGLVGALGGIAVYGLFHVATGLEPGLVGVPAGLLVGHAVRRGAAGMRSSALGKLCLVLAVAAFAFSHAPSALLRGLDGRGVGHALLSVALSVVQRLADLFLDQRMATFGGFAQIALGLIMVVAGGFIAQLMNE